MACTGPNKRSRFIGPRATVWSKPIRLLLSGWVSRESSMAAREGDTALWLHNKLGSTDDLWSGGSICSQLSREKLLSIQDCFHSLQPYVKVKLMLSFLHLQKRKVEEVSRPQLKFSRCVDPVTSPHKQARPRSCSLPLVQTVVLLDVVWIKTKKKLCPYVEFYSLHA